MYLLQFAELVAEGDEKLAVSLPLVGRQREDTGHVVAVRTFLLLGEVTHNVRPVPTEEIRLAEKASMQVS